MADEFPSISELIGRFRERVIESTDDPTGESDLMAYLYAAAIEHYGDPEFNGLIRVAAELEETRQKGELG